MNVRILMLFLAAAVLVSGCVQQPDPPPTRTNINEATLACASACERAKADSQDLSSGPCLSNKIIDNWVCDVVHAPREQVDNNPENQCPAYGGEAKHFIEVDPECNFIRAV